MFLKIPALLIVFLGLMLAQGAHAYTNQGVDIVNPRITLRLADKEGLSIGKHERRIKNELVALKKKHPKQFEEKLAQGLENTDSYQSYLLEIKDGLKQLEEAKKIAKFVVYQKVEKNWDEIKLTALNVHADKTFKKFRYSLLKMLNEKLVNIKPKKSDGKEGYHFEVSQWAYLTVDPSLKNIAWKIQFEHAYDNNQLEKGAEDIKIDSSGGDGDSGSLDMGEPQGE